jgi:hypothetical protein
LSGPTYDVTPALRLVVKVLQDVTRRQRFTSYADLSEAAKCRCARLKVPYDQELVSQAIDQLERGGTRPLIAAAQAPPKVEAPPLGEVLGRADAARIISEVRARLGAAAGPRSIR